MEFDLNTNTDTRAIMFPVYGCFRMFITKIRVCTDGKRYHRIPTASVVERTSFNLFLRFITEQIPLDRTKESRTRGGNKFTLDAAPQRNVTQDSARSHAAACGRARRRALSCVL